MAAHPVTALKGIIEDISKNESYPINQLEVAMAISCWTELLNTDDYVALREVIEAYKVSGDVKLLVVLCRALLVTYTATWEHLNRPTTMERWMNARYAEIRGTPELKYMSR